MNTEARGPRETQRDATARAVLDAARAEFERVGFEEASIRAVAAKAGVSAGTVLHHYGDKRGLLHAALWDDLEATLGKALAKLEGEGDVESRLPRDASAASSPRGIEASLAALGRAVFQYYERRPSLSRTLLQGSLFADEPWASRFRAQTAGVHLAIARRATQAKARGELREDANVEAFAAAWLSFFYFALIGWTQGGLVKPVTLVERLTAQHLAGLRPPPTTKRKKRTR